jgi:uncharacterized protein (TIGR02266 family)
LRQRSATLFVVRGAFRRRIDSRLCVFLQGICFSGCDATSIVGVLRFVWCREQFLGCVGFVSSEGCGLVMSDQSKRVHERVSSRVSVSFVKDNVSYQGESRNLSIGGLFLENSCPFAFGEKVTLRFRIPTHIYEISVNATVCWIEKQGDVLVGVGVRFESLRAIEVYALNKFLASQK